MFMTLLSMSVYWRYNISAGECQEFIRDARWNCIVYSIMNTLGSIGVHFSEMFIILKLIGNYIM